MNKTSITHTSSSIRNDFLLSSKWIELESYNRKIDLSFLKKSEFDKDIQEIENHM